MLKRIICAALALLMLVTLVACGGGDEPVNTEPNETGTSDVAGSDVESESESESETQGHGEVTDLKLAQKDWNGREFVLLCRDERMDHFGVTKAEDVEFGSSQLTKAVYERNETVQSTYNVNIKYEPVKSWSTSKAGEEMTQKVDASAQSGCPTYDAIAPDYYWGIETRGYFTNLLELENFDFDGVWWWTAWNDCYTLNNTLTSAVGWLTLDIVQGMEVVYFNRDMMPEVTDEDVYQLVYDKEWTLEKMKELSFNATYNVALPGAWQTETDYVHGTILHYMGNRSLFFSLGGSFTTYEDDGSVVYHFATDKNEQIKDLLNDWIFSTNEVFYARGTVDGVNVNGNENPKVTAQMFAEGHALFYCYGIKTAEMLAGLNMEFGILPPPVLEEGDDYRTTTFGTSFFCIERGRTDDQKDFASYILEVMNYYSYQIVREVYYEKTLKLQYGGADKEAKDMIDTVVESAYLDFAYLSGAGGLMGAMLNCIHDGTSLSAKWITISGSVDAALEQYLRGYLQ